MPWTVREEEDAMPLTDLLRTGEASRLRRRGAMRNGHRREDSEELPVRRVREPGADERRDGEVHLELSCGVRTSTISSVPSTSSRPSPLPQSQSHSTAESGFVYASTGCGAIVNSTASPRQPGCIAAYQVYTSRDISNPSVVRLPSKYLDSEQRSIVEFLVNEDCGCQCDWQAIGCSVCGNALGILFSPCHSRHSLDHSRMEPHSTYVFFPSSVTPSPAYTFPPIQHTSYRSMPPLVALSASDSDDMSIDSPTFSPRVQVLPNSEVAESQPYLIGGGEFEAPFAWFADPDPALVPTAPASPTTPTPLAFSTYTPDTRPELDPDIQGSSSFRPEDRRPSAHNARPFEIRRQSSARLRSRHQDPVVAGPRTDRDMPSDDDEWNGFLENDRVPSASRHLERRASGMNRNPLHPWMPRNQRDRSSQVPPLSERPMDPVDSATNRETPERSVAQSSIGLVTPVRSPEPPSLHRMPRRHPSTLAPPIRRPASFDTPTWRQYLYRPPRPPHMPEGQDRPRDGERASGAFRWPTPTSGVRPNRRLTVPGPLPPAFTLIDSSGERSYPPSTRSSLDARDSLNVESEVNSFRESGRHFGEDAHAEFDPQLSAPWMDRYALHTEEPEEEDEEKVDEERRADDVADRRALSEARGQSASMGQEPESSTSHLRRDTS